MPQEYVGVGHDPGQPEARRSDEHGLPRPQVMLTYEMPLGEIVLDFFDKLKSVSRGYASMDYEFKEYRASDVVKVDILLNGEKGRRAVDHRAPQPVAVPRPGRGEPRCARSSARQMYDVAIQAAIGANIIARETIKALAQERAGQVLRRRHFPQEEAPRKTESGQETHEADRFGRSARKRLSSRSCKSKTDPWHSSPPSVLAAFAGYALAPGTSAMVEGNFALLLFLATVVTGVYWLAERLYFLPRRRRAAAAARRFDRRRTHSVGPNWRQQGDDAGRSATWTRRPVMRLLMQPWWLDWTAGPVPGHRRGVPVALVPVRAVQDPVRIDDADACSSGDLILVNKFTYGLRLPVHQHEDHRRYATGAW